MPVAAAVLLGLTLAPAVSAKSRSADASRDTVGSIRVGRFVAERTCTTYVLTSGRVAAASRDAAEAATDGVDAAYARRSERVDTAEWRQDLVRDCRNEFPNLRASINRALASANAPIPSGSYTLNGRLSSVSVDGQDVTTGGYRMGQGRISVVVAYDLRSGGGRAIGGGVITKRVDLGSAFASEDYERTSESSDGYAMLQREVALAVARAAIFRVAPLRIVAVEGNRVRLNYGNGLLAPGAIVTADVGMSTLRFLVTSASAGGAIAELRGSGNPSRLPPGTVATFIEADDPAANTPAYERVDLP